MAHTPGPWTISPHRSQFLIRQDSGPEEDVPYRLIGEAYRQADACLIAAAPDLLEALLEVRNLLNGQEPAWYTKRYERIINTAIAKAEGRD